MYKITFRFYDETTEIFYKAEHIIDDLIGFIGVRYYPEVGEPKEKYWNESLVREIEVENV